MRTSETLNLAADLIEERGWNGIEQSEDQWGLKPGSPVCLEGALIAATETPRDRLMLTYCEWANICPAGAAVREYLGLGQAKERLDIAYGKRLYEWNDAPGRTAAEVVEVLRAAALIEAAKEAPHEDAANVSRTEAVSAL